MRRFVGKAIVFGIVLAASSAVAQNLGRASGPAELPPAGFGGKQFVDSRGCTFTRAGINGQPTWIPLVDRARNQICGGLPTFAAPPALKPFEFANETGNSATPPAPVAEAPKPVATPKPAPKPVITAKPKPVAPKPAKVAPPIKTIASKPVTPAPAPKVVEPPKPAVQPNVKRITRADVCQGSITVSPTYLNAATNQPVNCANGAKMPSRVKVNPRPLKIVTAPPAAPVAAPKPPVKTVTKNPAKPAAKKLTLAQACAQATQSGKTFINKATGKPIVCPQAAPSKVALAPVSKPPKGFKPVWKDGRLNPNRGLPKTAGVVSTKSVAPAAKSTTAGRYVQVGTFGVASNASATAARLKAMGLPVRVLQSTRGGKTYRTVLAGPFTNSSALNNGLGKARSAGFSDAFVRK